MGHQTVQENRARAAWALARRQHGVVTRGQLLALGLGSGEIKHRGATARLHPVMRGVYAVGRPELTRHGAWMAAALRCGPDAALSHESAAALWELRRETGGAIEVSVPLRRAPRAPAGIVVHRRAYLEATRRLGIPVTAPTATLVDLATCLSAGELEAAVNEADKHDLIDPEVLRAALDRLSQRRGVVALRRLLDRRTFTLTDSELERRFLPLARASGLPRPLTRQWVNGFRVDFYWPELGLVVETDGLRYHRTAAQQTADCLRDQAHAAADLTPLRFTHAQVAFDKAHVRSTLASVAGRLRRRAQVTRPGGPANAACSPRSTSARSRSQAS
jgi:very-short-patch-repair endonuclease